MENISKQISRLEHLSWTSSSKLLNAGICVGKNYQVSPPFPPYTSLNFLLFQIYMDTKIIFQICIQFRVTVYLHTISFDLNLQIQTQQHRPIWLCINISDSLSPNHLFWKIPYARLHLLNQYFPSIFRHYISKL